MKIIDGRVTILIGADSTTIELTDSEASITFAKVVLTPEQLSQALSRLSKTECSIQVFGLENIGKKMETATHEFEIPEDLDYKDRSEKLPEIIKATLPEGWVSDNYFSSQNTFFTRDGKPHARTTIRRWVNPE